MIKIFCIFAMGLVGSNYPMKADVLTAAHFSFSTSNNVSTMQEEFKSIENYPGYEISNLGRVKSVSRYVTTKCNAKRFVKERVLKQRKDKDGYYIVMLRNNIVKIHRAISIAFIPNPINKPQINHKNGIKSDNSITNLEWCTASENTIHSIHVLGNTPDRSGIKYVKGKENKFSKPLLQYTNDGKFINEFSCQREAAEFTGLTQGGISMAVNNKRATSGGYKWKYKKERN